MPCVLTTGFTLDCKTAAAGIKNIWLVEFDAKSTLTKSSGEVSAHTLSGGKLISDISKSPFAVLLFDEIEKAHPDVVNIMLQMLDEGKITGANGKSVDLKLLKKQLLLTLL